MSRQLTPYEKNFLLRHNFDFTSTPITSDIPVEYLVNTAEFKGHNFYVDQNTLIPRIETEQLVDLALQNIQTNFKDKEKITIADLCTGSGCVGISLALELVKNEIDFQIYLSDISPKALEVAKRNYNNLLPNYTENAIFLVSDLFNEYPKNTKFDLVVSNPPYIPSQNISKLQNNVKNYEPILALDGGQDGAELINKIISLLPKYQINVNAILEIDDTHDLSNIKSEGLNPSLFTDQFGVNRFLSLFLL